MNSWATIFFSLLALAQIVPRASAASEAAPIKYAVMPFAIARGIDAEASKLLDEVFLTSLSKRAGEQRTFLGASDISAVLGLEQQKQMLACNDESCMAELGNALGVDFLISPSLGKLGNKFVITVKIIEPSTVRVARRETLTVDGQETALIAAMDQLAAVLLDDHQAAPSAASSSTPARAAEKNAPAQQDKVKPRSDGDDDPGMSALRLSGLVLASVGLVSVLASSGGISYADMTLANAQSSGDEKSLAVPIYIGGLGGVALGALLLTSGAVMFAVGD